MSNQTTLETVQKYITSVVDNREVIMSFRNNKKIKRVVRQHLPFSEGRFVALRFIDTLDELYDKTESIVENPNITFNENSVIVDYGYVLNSSKSSLEKVLFFFRDGLNKNDIITLSDGEYLNEMSGDSEIRDYSGTYYFKSFDTNLLIASLEKISINNESSYYNKLNKDYFISNSIKWTTTSSEKKIVKTNEIVNELGSNSLNSFVNTLGAIGANDILEIIISNEEIKRFTVEEYKSENDIERIIVKEDVSEEEDLFGTSTFVRLLRIPSKTDSSSNTTTTNRSISPPPTPKATRTQPPSSQKKTTPQTPTPKATRTQPTIRPSFTSKERVRSLKNKKSYETKWNNSGKEIFNVEVTTQGDRNVYAINGIPQKKLTLNKGKTYRFNTKHSSMGNKGFTNNNHPLVFSTRKDARIPDGTIVDSLKTWKSPKKEGSRGSYQYLEIPHNIKKTNIYYACGNHKDMGGIIRLSSSASLAPHTNNPEIRGAGIPWDDPIIPAPANRAMCSCCDGTECGDGNFPGSESSRTGGCWSCIWKAIRKVESSWVKDRCENPCNCVGDNGNACGPFQIWKSYLIDAIEKCQGILTEFGLTGAAAAHGTLCKPCPSGDTACCTKKWNLSKRIIECYMQRYAKPGRGKYKGTGRDGCFTCEDIARIHNGGPRGHRINTTDDYWRKVKDKMKEMCEENCQCCDCCGSKSGTGMEATAPSECEKGSCGEKDCDVCCRIGTNDDGHSTLIHCYDDITCEECNCFQEDNNDLNDHQFVCKASTLDPPEPCGWKGCDKRKYIGGCDAHRVEATLTGPCESLPPHIPGGGWIPACEYYEWCQEHCTDGQCGRPPGSGPGSIG